MARSLTGALLLPALLLAWPARAHAQEPPDSILAALDTATVAADTAGISPRSAMIRSWLVPGWGQASVGAYGRGGFFVAAQGASWYMLLKTIGKLAEARAVETARVTWVSDSLNAVLFADPASDLADPEAYQEALDGDERVARARSLVESRRQQRQDWITGTLFLTLISGVDAFVAAHLADAPVSVETAVAPDGAVRLGVRLPIDRRR